ncbi:glycosyltransferase family 2 protein [Salinibacter ruber]|uniref:glycosyltransferase family 2 protein n=1 Tax=Salinibacter ruber TaxID=146919 RepID=UPI002169AA5F|nr:glycosyltransferase family A protein [Salinibacter ruber]MCS3638173.1 glycosyltransferase involved in cell wall biosynthesis [Salinibacter ruber]
MTKLVSVIIPTYNREKTIRHAIESVYAQSYPNIEIIVVDDGSEDNTGQVVSDMTRENLVYCRHDINRGAPAARNTGLEQSSGDYIAFLDSDDEWTRDKISKQVSLLKDSRPKVGMCYTGVVFNENGQEVYSCPTQKDSDISNLVYRNMIGGYSSVMVKPNVLETVGNFDERLKGRQDLDMWLRISKQYEIQFVKEPLTIINKRKDISRISNNLITKAISFIQFYKKHKDEIEKNRKTGRYMMRLGRFIQLKTEKKNMSRLFYKKAIREDPWLIKCYAYLLKSYLARDL